MDSTTPRVVRSALSMGRDQLLPDSRAKRDRSIAGPGGIQYVPIYCINCGKRYGFVPASMITHVTALCDQGCAGKFGDEAHFYADGDTKIRQDGVEAVADLMKKLGRPVTLAELDRRASEDSTSALAAVARDWNARVRAHT